MAIYKINPFTGKLDLVLDLQEQDIYDARYLKLDQTTPQTTTGTFVFPAINTPSIISTSGAISFDNENLSTTGTLSAGAITGTSYTIGANSLTTSEWAYLDGQDQAVKTTSTPQFLRLGLGAPADATDELYVAGTSKFYATADVYTTIASGAVAVTRTTDTNPALATYISASGVQEAQPRYLVSISGKNSWGDGTNAIDTNLYRSAADTLKTDDNFIAGGDITSVDDIFCGDNLVLNSANSIISFSETGWGKIQTTDGTLYLNYDYPNNAIHLGSPTGYAKDRINGSLAYLVGAGDPTPVANYGQVFAKDVSTSAEMFVQDEAGNETQISPHDPETGEYIFYSENIYTGRKVRINMEQLVRAVEKLTGKTFLIEEFTSNKKKWEDREYPDGLSTKELNKLKAESPVRFVADAVGAK